LRPAGRDGVARMVGQARIERSNGAAMTDKMFGDRLRDAAAAFHTQRERAHAAQGQPSPSLPRGFRFVLNVAPSPLACSDHFQVRPETSTINGCIHCISGWRKYVRSTAGQFHYSARLASPGRYLGRSYDLAKRSVHLLVVQSHRSVLLRRVSTLLERSPPL
jgi:hypothetical protein